MPLLFATFRQKTKAQCYLKIPHTIKILPGTFSSSTFFSPLKKGRSADRNAQSFSILSTLTLFTLLKSSLYIECSIAKTNKKRSHHHCMNAQHNIQFTLSKSNVPCNSSRWNSALTPLTGTRLGVKFLVINIRRD